MAFLSSSGSSMRDMNITPLVDVMLVLLVIFMVTVPAISHPIPVALPTNGPTEALALEPIRLHIDASGAISWNGAPVTIEELESRFRTEAARGLTANGVIDPNRQPLLKIDADRGSEYQLLAQVLARANNASLTRIGFVEPVASL
jgi:biopolymer transport protein ExbD